MAKVKFKNQEDLKMARKKGCGSVSYRQMKDGRIIAAKWPSRKKPKN